MQRCKLAAMAMAAVIATGCGGSDTPQQPPVAKTASKTTPKPKPVERDPQEIFQEQLALAESALEEDQFPEADRIALELQESQDQLNAESAKRLEALRAKLDSQRAERLSKLREEHMASAQTLLADGDLEGARQAVNEVLKFRPTAEQQEQSRQINDEINRRRRARRKLMTAMELLASAKTSDVTSARITLRTDPEEAVPLLLDAVKSEDSVLASNAMRELRLFNQPERTLPAVVAVLERPAQQKSWPAAIRELQASRNSGAGELLLKLATSAESPEQRAAALEALSGVIDPPRETIVSLLPLLSADGPELAPALEASLHAVLQHGQFDLLARRGLGGELSNDQREQFNRLPARLTELAAGLKESGSPQPAARAAQSLRVITRQAAAEPIAGVKILRFGAEDEAGPAAAVLDGVWNKSGPENLWRHRPNEQEASIVLDLGAMRTVTGIRFYNYNEQGNGYRGWQKVDLYVSDSPAPLDLTTSATLARAPGAPDTADYSVLVTIPCVQGRYVRLQGRTFWRTDGWTGLTEIQVLGF